MHKKRPFFLSDTLIKFISEFPNFISFLSIYLKKKLVNASIFFETNKNGLVRVFVMKRGRYNRPFLHFVSIFALGLGVLIAPFLASTYPVFSSESEEELDVATASAEEQSIAVGEDVFQTQISSKPRDKIIEYTIQKGDTVSSIGKKFGISAETIKSENDMTSDSLTVGDTLKILPVTGIAHKVQKGDSVYTIAKKYSTDAQAIVNFPFNDFANPETFSLVEGQILIVPDGVEPSERPVQRRQVFLATGPSTGVYSSGFASPLNGPVSQFPAWYHMALDITSPVGTPIYSAQSGTVTKVSTGTWDGGYGNNIMIDNGGGFQTLYAHMSRVNVGIGQEVVAGRTIVGYVGLTGRTTGSHLHFEIRRNGALVNPLPYIR